MHLALYRNFSLGEKYEPSKELERDFADCDGFSVLSDAGKLIRQKEATML